MCGSRKYPYPPLWRVMEIPRDWGGCERGKFPKKNVLSLTNYKDKAYNFIEVFLVKDKSKCAFCLMLKKKHLVLRLMIPADKRSQFTATRTKINTKRGFYSTDDKNYTRVIQKYLGD